MHSIVRCSTEDAVSTIVHGPWPMPHGPPAALLPPTRRPVRLAQLSWHPTILYCSWSLQLHVAV